MSKRIAAFLDRDGVINSYVYNTEFGTIDSPSTPEEFTMAPGAGEAIAELNRLGLMVVVVSNQPGIAKGKFSAALLEQVTAKMHRSVGECDGALDAVYYCLHHPEAVLAEYRTRCECRKPAPGLLLRASQELEIDLGGSFMVGDGIMDIEAGHTAGTKTVYVGQWKPYIREAFENHRLMPDFVASSLMAAVNTIKLQLAAAAANAPTCAVGSISST